MSISLIKNALSNDVARVSSSVHDCYEVRLEKLGFELKESVNYGPWFEINQLEVKDNIWTETKVVLSKK